MIKNNNKYTRYNNLAKHEQKHKIMAAAGNSYAAKNEVDGEDIFMTPRRNEKSIEVSPIRVISLKDK